MNAQQLAALLNGREYLREITTDEAQQAKTAGLVVVHGGSDDLIYFAGAISDELGAGNGTEVLLTDRGLLKNDCENEDCPYFEESKVGAKIIESLWCKEPGYSWTYKTDIPHATFEVVEDGGPYCRGIVFALADVGKTETTFQQRVVTEKRELDEKIEKLQTFIDSDKFSIVYPQEQTRLLLQIIAMQSYSGILRDRIAAAA